VIVKDSDYPEKGPLGELPHVAAALAPYVGYLVFAAFVRAQRIAVGALGSDLHPRLLVVLAAIDERPMSQRDLGERLDLGRNTMVGIVDALEGKRLVERRRDPADRRANRLVVTERGGEVLAASRPIMRRCDAQLTERLDVRDRARLAALLRELLAGLGDTRLPASLVDRTGFLIARAHLRMHGLFERALEPLGIQPRHFGALAVCAHTAGSQQALASELGVSGTIVVELVDALEQRGFVERRRNSLDRRSYVIVPTPTGEVTLTRASEAAAELERRIAGVIGADGLAELTALLRTLLGAA
jgi:DNA-binding MarR family transcriptional regulator